MKMKKTIAMLLTSALAIGMCAPAFAAGTDFEESGPVTGEGDIKNPVINYVLPTTLAFSLDAFGMGDATGSTIYSPKYDVINYSEVGIKVDVKADLTLDSTVKLKSSAADVKIDDPTYTDKDLYMEMVAQEVTAFTATITTGTPSAPTVTATAMTYTATGADTKAKAVLAATSSDVDYKKPTLMTLALEKATYDASHVLTAVAGKTNAGAIRFAGTINPNATFISSTPNFDVVVKAVFDVRGLTSANYAKMITNNVDLDATLKAANVYSVGAGATSGPSFVTNVTGGVVMPSAGTATIEINVADATGVAAVKYGTAAGTYGTTAVLGTDYTVSAVANGKLTITLKNGASAIGGANVKLTGKFFEITMAKTGDATYAKTLTFETKAS